MSNDIIRFVFGAQGRRGVVAARNCKAGQAYRDTVEACIPEGIEEELLPQYVPVPKVGYSLVTMEVSYPARDMFHSQRDRPDTIVRVTVKPGILATPSRIVLFPILVRGLRGETHIKSNRDATGVPSHMTNLKDSSYIHRFHLNRSRSLRGAIKRNFRGSVFHQKCNRADMYTYVRYSKYRAPSADSATNLNHDSSVILLESYSAIHVERKK